MRRHFSILFAVAIFFGLSLMETTRAEAQGGVALDSAQVEVILRDSMNAHAVAQMALGAIGCLVSTMDPEMTDYSPSDCLDRLKEEMKPLQEEHRFLHPQAVGVLNGERRSTRS